MFYNATAFNNGGSASIGNWVTTSVTSMSSMFRNTAFNQPIGSWDISNNTSTYVMFGGTPFNQPLNTWNLTNVIYVQSMFLGATAFNQPLNNWVMPNVTSFFQMFYGATAFNQDISNWDISLVTEMSNMLLNTALSTANYDLLLTGWTGWTLGAATKTVQSSVNFNASPTKYSLLSDAEAARAWLVGTKLWTITDGGGI